MFIQVIQGHVSDVAALRAQFDRWLADYKPPSVGWHGMTSGVTGDGEFVGVVRFADEAAARANSDRPEQGEWWKETEKLFDGPVEFHDYPNVELFLSGGADDAGFVQVIQGVYGGEGSPALAEEDTAELADRRPDVIGGSIGWDAGGHFTQTVYFTSEAAARAGEAQMEDLESRQRFEEWQAQVDGLRFLDLTEPWFA